MASCGWCGTTDVDTDHVAECRRPVDRERFDEARASLEALRAHLGAAEYDFEVTFRIVAPMYTRLAGLLNAMEDAATEYGGRATWLGVL